MDTDFLEQHAVKEGTNEEKQRVVLGMVEKEPLTLEQVHDTLVDIAKEEGATVDDEAYVTLNIGSAGDRAETYMLLMAISDYVFYKLRLALGASKIDALTYSTLERGLQDCGFPKPGISKFADMTQDLRSRIEGEEKAAEEALQSLAEVRVELGKTSPELAKKMKVAMDLLNIGSADLPSSIKDEYTLTKFVDDFLRFLNFAEGGEPLTDLYYGLVEEIFHMKAGLEKGYVILGSKRRQPNLSPPAFRDNARKHAQRVIKKLSDRLKGCSLLPRLSLHLASPGEIMPVGYVPEERDVMTIDKDGSAKTILSVHSKYDPKTGLKVPIDEEVLYSARKWKEMSTPAPKEEKLAPKVEEKLAPKEKAKKPAPKEEKLAPKVEEKPAPKEEKLAPKVEEKPAPKEEKLAPKEKEALGRVSSRLRESLLDDGSYRSGGRPPAPLREDEVKSILCGGDCKTYTPSTFSRPASMVEQESREGAGDMFYCMKCDGLKSRRKVAELYRAREDFEGKLYAAGVCKDCDADKK